MPDITMYDINIDARRVVTQEDVDRLVEIVQKLSVRREPVIPTEDLGRLPNFRLAIYLNPMRDDGVFVSEEKPITPYDHTRGINGEPLYPATPDTPYTLRSQLPHAFAYELVRRWNLVADHA